MSNNENSKFCYSCGNELVKEAEICPKCGVRQPLLKSEKKKKDKLTAGLLGLFLGGFGIHKFYLGETGIGVFYLLLNTLGWFVTWLMLGIPNAVVGIIVLIESIKLLTMSEEEFDKKYNP